MKNLIHENIWNYSLHHFFWVIRWTKKVRDIISSILVFIPHWYTKQICHQENLNALENLNNTFWLLVNSSIFIQIMIKNFFFSIVCYKKFSENFPHNFNKIRKKITLGKKHNFPKISHLFLRKWKKLSKKTLIRIDDYK